MCMQTPILEKLSEELSEDELENPKNGWTENQKQRAFGSMVYPYSSFQKIDG